MRWDCAAEDVLEHLGDLENQPDAPDRPAGHQACSGLTLSPAVEGAEKRLVGCGQH